MRATASFFFIERFANVYCVASKSSPIGILQRAEDPLVVDDASDGG